MSSVMTSARAGIIGEGELVPGPWGPRRMVYADHTASGRAHQAIEDAVRAALASYGNVHSESSYVGRQTTRYREQARAVIHEAVRGSADDVVIFCGSGATSAAHKLVSALGLRVPEQLEGYRLRECVPELDRPVVLTSAYEHHSNLLPWRESIAVCETVAARPDGSIDLDDLDRRLVRHAGRPMKIGAFSAASNVTGIITDTEAVARVLHAHGALAVFDCAAAAPHLDIDMNPPGAEKDAIFLSPHKFLGGPGTPGVLVAKRRLFTARAPTVPGGGTVAYVNAVEHAYAQDLAQREEGGTPAIVESIRAGLVFMLRASVGVEAIAARERALVRHALDAWRRNPQLQVLGNVDAERLPIVSLLVRHTGAYLHHNFVVALLSDLFGIQARGGCSCAEPYGHLLLGIPLDTARTFGTKKGLRPGWVRLSFPFYWSDEEVAYVINAVELAAREGWRVLDEYLFDPSTGAWTHRASPRDLDLRHLLRAQPATRARASLRAQMHEAERILLAKRRAERPSVVEGRWFVLPASQDHEDLEGCGCLG